MLEINNNSVEWEILQEPLIIEEILPNEWIPKNPVSITVTRTDSYQIRAVLTATEDCGPLSERDTEYRKRYHEVSPGSRREPFNIEGRDQHGSKVELKNCYITNISSSEKCNPERSTTLNSKRLVTLSIIVYEVKIEKNSEYEASSLVEWYINGPNDGVLFPKMTLRLQENGSDKAARKKFEKLAR